MQNTNHLKIFAIIKKFAIYTMHWYNVYIGIQTVIYDHTGLAEVSREFAVEAVEDGALRYDSSGIRTDVRVASSVDDLGVVLDDI